MRLGSSLLPIGLLLAAGLARAEDPPFPAAAPPPGGPGLPSLSVHGFVLGTASVRTTGLRPAGGEGGEFILGEERLRLDVSAATASGQAFLLAKGDLLHDAVGGTLDVDFREGYAGWTRGPLELRLGRQIVTWGVGDLVFINDVFPKDWESFFSGRPMEYLKLGIDGLLARVSSSVVSAELAAVPFFTEDRLPSRDRFFLFDPAAGVPRRHESEPDTRWSNVELALRLYRRIAGLDGSLYAYRGFWRTPGVRFDDFAQPSVAERIYPRLSVYGLSVQRGLLEGVLSLEAGYYDSTQDRSGDDPAIANSQERLLVGYQRELLPDFTAGVQVYGETMDDHRTYRRSLPPGSPRQDRLRWVVTTRLTQWLDYQAWRLTLFVAVSPSDEDYFLQPEVSYKVTDALTVSVGANVFGGREETTLFGQLEKNDNVFANVRYDF